MCVILWNQSKKRLARVRKTAVILLWMYMVSIKMLFVVDIEEKKHCSCYMCKLSLYLHHEKRKGNIIL